MRIEIQDKTITKRYRFYSRLYVSFRQRNSKRYSRNHYPHKKEIQTKDINVEIPHLKYNKTWMLMLTQDDCMQAAFCRTWAAINGKPISSSIPYPTPTPTDQNMKHQLYFDIKHLQKGIFPLLLFPPTNLWDVQTEQEMKFGLLLLPLLPLKKNGWMLKQTYCRGLLQTIIVFI